MTNYNVISLLTYCRMLKYLRKLKNKSWYKAAIENRTFIRENNDDITMFFAPFTHYTEEKCFCNKPI